MADERGGSTQTDSSTGADSTTLTLRPFGAIHADRRDKVANELAEFAGDVDAYFIEHPPGGVSPGAFARCAVRAPLFALGIAILTLLQAPVYAVLCRDLLPAETVAARRLAADRGVPIYAVDDHPVLLMAEAGPGWILVNWLGLATVGLVLPWATLLTYAAGIGGWFVISGAYRLRRELFLIAVWPTAVLGLFAILSLVATPWVLAATVGVLLLTTVLTLGGRNETMLDRIITHAEADDHAEVCLTTGRAHLPGIVAAARERGVAVPAQYVPRWLRSGRVDQDPGSTRAVGDPATPASLASRVVAGAVDLIGIGATAAVLALIGGTIGSLVSDAGAPVPGLPILGLVIGTAAAPILYGFVPEAVGATSPGKRLLGLVVIDREGRRIRPRRALLRNLLRPIDLVGFYLVGFVTLLVTDRRQRLGDIVAGTYVVPRADTDSS